MLYWFTVCKQTDEGIKERELDIISGLIGKEER